MTYTDMIGEVEMSVSYDKLWKILIDKKMKRLSSYMLLSVSDEKCQ